MRQDSCYSVELDSKYRVESVQRFSLMINDSVMEIWKACMSIQTLENLQNNSWKKLKD